MVGRYALEFQCFHQPELLWDKTHCVDIEKQVKNAQLFHAGASPKTACSSSYVISNDAALMAAGFYELCEKKKKNSGNDILTKLVTDQHIPIMQLLEAVSPRIFFLSSLFSKRLLALSKTRLPKRKKLPFFINSVNKPAL